jgi:hypothetical protein
VLSGNRFVDAPVVEPKPPGRLVAKLTGAVGRGVVGEHDLDRPRVREAGDPLKRGRDRVRLVPGRYQDGHPRPAARGPDERQLAVGAEQEREEHEPDH